jgi:hypothetical protein
MGIRMTMGWGGRKMMMRIGEIVVILNIIPETDLLDKLRKP